MLPRNILPWKILWFFYNLFKHMLPGHISENQFANKNRPTTCKIYENLVYAFHISKTDVTSYLQLFETKKKLYMPCLCFVLLFFRRNFAPAYGLPFQCNLTYFYYFFGWRRFSTFLFSVAHLPQKWPTTMSVPKVDWGKP